MARRLSYLVLPILLLGLAGAVAAATWQEPTAAPTGANRERPIHVGSDAQEKTGPLLLTSGNNVNLLYLRNLTVSSTVGFKAPAAAAIYNLTWPNSQAPYAQSVLIADTNGNMSWFDRSVLAGQDTRWISSGSSYPAAGTYMYAAGNVRIGDENGATSTEQANTRGSLYVKTNLEVDNNFFLGNASNFSAMMNVQLAGFREGLALRLPASNAWSPINIQNSAGASFFRVNERGELTMGTSTGKFTLMAGNLGNTNVTWKVPTDNGSNGWFLATDGSGNLYWTNPAMVGLPNGSHGDTLRFDSTLGKWVSGGFLYNNNNQVTIGMATGTSDGFVLQTKGSIGPADNNVYDLGSAARRWRKLYVSQLDLGLKPGSVVFVSSSGSLYEDNDNFFWADDGNQLGIGNNTPQKTVDIKGDLRVAAPQGYGAIYFSGELGAPFIHDYGESSVFIGHNMAFSAISRLNAVSSVFIGDYSGYSEVSQLAAQDAVGIGFMTLAASADTVNDVAIGAYAMYNANSGGNNIALGRTSLSQINGGYGNIAIGTNAMTGANVNNSLITAIGYNAGAAVYEAQSSVYLGAFAGYDNNFGNRNVMLGNMAGGASSRDTITDISDGNVFVGYSAGYDNYRSFNTFLGAQAGENSGNSRENVFLGYKTGLKNIGNGNVFIGAGAASFLDGENLTGALVVDYNPGSATNSHSRSLLFGKFLDAGAANPYVRANGALVAAKKNIAALSSSFAYTDGGLYLYNSHPYNDGPSLGGSLGFYTGLTTATCFSKSVAVGMESFKHFYIDGILVCKMRLNVASDDCEDARYTLNECCRLSGNCGVQSY